MDSLATTLGPSIDCWLAPGITAGPSTCNQSSLGEIILPPGSWSVSLEADILIDK